MVVLNPSETRVRGGLLIPDVPVGSAAQLFHSTLGVAGAPDGREHARDSGAYQSQLGCGIVVRDRLVIGEIFVLIASAKMQEQRWGQSAFVVQAIHVRGDEDS